MFVDILEQSLLFLPLTLGLYISFVVLRIPDLTTDGSFVFGAAVFAVCLQGGVNPWMASGLAMAGGALSGAASSFLQNRFQLNPLIAGILLLFILNTATLKLMGKPNLSLLEYPTLFSEVRSHFLGFFALLLIPCTTLFLASRIGLMLHAFGNNATLLCLCGKSSPFYRTLGLALSNGLVGFGGALTAQAHGYADIGMGTGMVLTILGTLIIGEQLHRLLKIKRLLGRISCALLGVILYFSVVNILVSLGLDPLYLRMMMGLCLIGFFAATKRDKILGASP